MKRNTSEAKPVSVLKVLLSIDKLPLLKISASNEASFSATAASVVKGAHVPVRVSPLWRLNRSSLESF